MRPVSGAEQRVIRFGTRVIRYSVDSGDHRDLLITVTPDLEVGVRAPRSATVADIDAAVIAKAPWILRHQLRYQDLHPLPVPRRFVAGETHRYLGRQFRLRIEKGENEQVRIDRPFLVVTVLSSRNEERVRQLVQQWYRLRAERVFPTRLEEALQSHPSLKSPDIRMCIRIMRARWGSCSPTGLLSINPELVRAPTSCIDYVIVHELCHRKIMNHGRTFQQLLTRVMPDWRARRERLNRFIGE